MAAYGSFWKISLKTGTSKIPPVLDVGVFFYKYGRNKARFANFSLNLADTVYADNG
jgi:hypothetical protein